MILIGVYIKDHNNELDDKNHISTRPELATVAYDQYVGDKAFGYERTYSMSNTVSNMASVRKVAVYHFQDETNVQSDPFILWEFTTDRNLRKDFFDMLAGILIEYKFGYVAGTVNPVNNNAIGGLSSSKVNGYEMWQQAITVINRQS